MERYCIYCNKITEHERCAILYKLENRILYAIFTLGCSELICNYRYVRCVECMMKSCK